VEKRPVTMRQVGIALGAFAALCLAGTIGFHLITGESLFDALYRTVITVYTAGLVPAPESVGAKAFTIVLVVWGVAIFLYVFGLVIELAVSGTIGGAWQERRTRRRVDRLTNHYIICGYGRVGRRVAREFREARVPYVVLDHNPEVLAIAHERDELVIEGSGTDAAKLEQAGLARARGLVASSDSDVDNLYITLSGRAARPDLQIVARASTRDAAEKMALAGADRVVQPYAAAGQEMAKLMLKPQVSAFLEIVTTHAGPDLRFEEIVVSEASGQVGRTIRDLRIRRDTGAVIISIRRGDGTFDTTPSPDYALAAGDVLIAVGTEEELRSLEELFAPHAGIDGGRAAVARRDGPGTGSGSGGAGGEAVAG
jgi:voltage-gated potassium channel